mgnify:CR=1 FL=1
MHQGFIFFSPLKACFYKGWKNKALSRVKRGKAFGLLSSPQRITVSEASCNPLFSLMNSPFHPRTAFWRKEKDYEFIYKYLQIVSPDFN